MPNTDNSKTVTVVIDGASVTAEYRTPLLEVAKKIGVEIPTLCHHEALEPAGACRLCIVEEKRDGWSKFVTACNYPVTDGMVFETDSQEVRAYRKMTMEALLARCPQVPAIQSLAKKLGVERSRFLQGDDTCILCGMCTRVCESYATSAISTMGRGNDKKVGTFASAQPEDCVGCGSCASICPTDHIPVAREGTNYRIWDKDFPVPVCGVEKSKCMACGACEEACPFSIPRVVLRKGGETFAEIRPDACKGCGVCLAACPAGAIEQPRSKRDIPADGNQLLVIACGRSALKRTFAPPLPEAATVLELPCVGGATVAGMLGALARGYAGVLVLGRHEDTCKLDGSEAQARLTAQKASRLAQLAGLGKGRVRFMEPAPGPEGPVIEVEDMLDDLKPSVLKEFAPAELPTDTMDDVLGLLEWLGERSELNPDPSSWLATAGFARAKNGAKTDDIPYLDILLGDLLAPEDLSQLVPSQAREGGLAVLPFKRNGLVLKADPGNDNDTTASLVHRMLKQRHGAWRRSHDRPLEKARREVTK